MDPNRGLSTRLLSTAALLLALPIALCSAAADPRSFFTLTTGNGHGFQLFDAKAGRFVGFLDHPYRYVRAPENDPTDDGPERRNLLEDFSIGVRRHRRVEPLVWKGDASYERQTNILRVSAKGAKGYFFAPFGLERNAMVALVRVGRLSLSDRGVFQLKFHLGGTPKSKIFWQDTLEIVKLPGEKVRRLDDEPAAWAQTGKGPGTMIYLPLSPSPEFDCYPAACEADELTSELRMRDTGGWFGMLVAYEEDPAKVDETAQVLREWAAGRSPKRIHDDALREFEAWRKTPRFKFKSAAERRVWRQNETVLRMGQVREPNIREPGHLRVNHGMILAGLPPGNWATGWVRDGSYATAALARMGHLVEAKASLDFMLNAEPMGKFKQDVHGADYRISLTRHYGSGEEEADYSTQKDHNVEMDDWGLYLWAARTYLDASNDKAWLFSPTRKGTVYEALRDGVAAALEQNLEPVPGAPASTARIVGVDTSIWEGNGEPRQHYAFTTLMAARGLMDFAAIARKAGKTADAEHFAALAGDVQKGFIQAFDSERGLIGSLTRRPATDIDGAMVEAFSMGVLQEPKGPVGRKTLANLERLKLATGGYKRNGGSDDYEINEWIFIDLRLASAFYRLGERRAEADSLIARNVAKAEANFDLIPEEYNATGKDGAVGSVLGSVPMVGYGAGTFTLAVLDREGL